MIMLSDELSKLRELHDAGELSDEEYSAAKAQLLKQPHSLQQSNRPDRDELGGMTPSTYATVLHLSHYGGLILPFAGFIIPIGMWLYAKDRNEFIDQHGRSSANFMISCFIYSVIYSVVMGVIYSVVIGSWYVAGILGSSFQPPPFAFPAFLFFLIPVIPFWMICVLLPIFAANAALKGQAYRYPLTLKIF